MSIISFYSINTKSNSYKTNYSENQRFQCDVQNLNYCYNYTEIGQFDDNYGFAWSASIFGDYLYIAKGFGGLYILDISEPTSPILLSNYCDGGNAYEVFVVEDYAFLADGLDGLEIFNISDKTNPIKLAGVFDGGLARSIFVSEGIAYITDFKDGLEIIDVRNEYTPNKICHFNETNTNAWDVIVKNDYIFVANKEIGLEIINLKDKTSPKKVGWFHDGGEAQGVFVNDYYIFVADRYDNLEIISLDSDYDGLIDGEEVFEYGTDPQNSDTDQDQFTDLEEIIAGTDPLNPSSNPETRTRLIYIGSIGGSIFIIFTIILFKKIVQDLLFLYQKRK